MKFLKQLLCTHIWIDKKEEFCGKRWEDISSSAFLSGRYAYFNHYVTHRVCVKCGKVNIKSIRKMILS